MRKVILYIAMSLDGFIADENGGVDWLKGHTEKEHDDTGYQQFISQIDTVIMGYTTYHQIVTELSKGKWFYDGLQSYILTHRKEDNQKEIMFVDQPVQKLITDLCKEEGKDIWICGGADIVKQCLENNLIDEFIITVIPTILGKGVYMFCELNQSLPLHLSSIKEDNGMVELIYQKRK